MTDKNQIFKLQKSLNAPSVMLIYNKNRSIFDQFPLSDEVAKFMEDKFKIYVYGTIESDGQVRINGVAPEQRW